MILNEDLFENVRLIEKPEFTNMEIIPRHIVYRNRMSAPQLKTQVLNSLKGNHEETLSGDISQIIRDCEADLKSSKENNNFTEDDRVAVKNHYNNYLSILKNIDKNIIENSKVKETFSSKLKELEKVLNESLKEDLEGPATPEDNGVAKLLLQAINDESDTIQFYNDLIANTDNEDIIAIINDINEEENNHIGMLSKALAIVSPNAEAIEDGQEEAEEMIDEEESKDEIEIINVDDEIEEHEFPFGESLNERRAKSWVLFFDDEGVNRPGSDGSHAMSVMPANAIKVISQPDYHIPKWAKTYVVITPSQFEMMSYKSLEKYHEKYGKPVPQKITEDLHDKFRRDIKTEYKLWARKVEKAEAKRKEAMEMIPDNATDEQIAKYTEYINDMYPMPKFDYKFPHNLEKDDYPFYVTFYSEYPIYEPAEGGYYYAGVDAVWSEGANSKEEAQKIADAYVQNESHDFDEPWEKYTDGYLLKGHYIGEDQRVIIEPRKSYLSGIKGWEPYQ